MNQGPFGRINLTPHQFKEWRKALGWSQRAAAEVLGLSESTIELYERGMRKDNGRPVEIPVAVVLACAYIVGHISSDARFILSDAEWGIAAACKKPTPVRVKARRPKEVINKRETTLDRLHRRGTIDRAQLKAGLLFRDDPECGAVLSKLPNTMRSVADHVIRQNISISEWVRTIKPQGTAMNRRLAGGLVVGALVILAEHYGVTRKALPTSLLRQGDANSPS